MHDYNLNGPAADFTNLGADDLLAEAKSLDTLISNLEVEAFRHASSGLQHRSVAAFRKAKDLKRRRDHLLAQLQMRNARGQFGDLGAPPKKKAASEVKAMREAAFRKRADAERRVFKSEQKLTSIAKKVAGKALVGAPGVMPDDIKVEFFEMAKAARDYAEASGAIEVIQSGNTLRRQAGERDGIQMLLRRYGRFFNSLPKNVARKQWEAFNLGNSGYRGVLTRMARPRAVEGTRTQTVTVTACVPNSKCSIVLKKVVARPKRKISATKLKNIKKTIILKQGARLPDPMVMRIIGQRLAQRLPRPADMREELYADLILELTKRAAIHTANAQAGGATTAVAVTEATQTVLTQDLPAVKEEVSTGVTAPAGEEVAAAAVQAAASQILQGAADAGALPSVPAAPAAQQQQVAQIAASADPAAATAAAEAASAAPSAASSAGVVTDSSLEAAFSVSPADGTASITPAAQAPSTTDSLPAAEAVVEAGGAESGIAESDETPFYKRPLVLTVGALAVVGGYMYWRSRDTAGAVPSTPTPAAE
jgi:hypothetical protein